MTCAECGQPIQWMPRCGFVGCRDRECNKHGRWQHEWFGTPSDHRARPRAAFSDDGCGACDGPLTTVDDGVTECTRCGALNTVEMAL